MTSLDPRDTPADLRSYADLLRDLAADREAVRTPEAREALTVIAAGLDARAERLDASLGTEAEERQAEAVRLALLRRQDAAHGVLRMMRRPAPVPVVPRPAAAVLPFRPRTTSAMPVPVSHEITDISGGAA